MGKKAVKLNLKDFKKNIQKQCKDKAAKLADSISTELTDKYISLIDDYYHDKEESDSYKRTYNLYKSAIRLLYDDDSNSMYYGGVDVNASNMSDYHSKNGEVFSPQRLLDKYIFPTTMPSATWHGGNWSGGYGQMAEFSIYHEMIKFRDHLITEINNNR